MKPPDAVPAERAGGALAPAVARRCRPFRAPLLVELDTQLDVRLVRPVAQRLPLLIRHRHRALAWLLTELGRLLCGPPMPAPG